jgi:hypothetical protein
MDSAHPISHDELHSRWAFGIFTRSFLSDGSEECLTAINVSRKDHLTLSISVAVGSTIVSWPTATKSSRVLISVQRSQQTALFVIPSVG